MSANSGVSRGGLFWRNGGGARSASCDDVCGGDIKSMCRRRWRWWITRKSTCKKRGFPLDTSTLIVCCEGACNVYCTAGSCQLVMCGPPRIPLEILPDSRLHDHRLSSCQRYLSTDTAVAEAEKRTIIEGGSSAVFPPLRHAAVSHACTDDVWCFDRRCDSSGMIENGIQLNVVKNPESDMTTSIRTVQLATPVLSEISDVWSPPTLNGEPIRPPPMTTDSIEDGRSCIGTRAAPLNPFPISEDDDMISVAHSSYSSAPTDISEAEARMHANHELRLAETVAFDIRRVFGDAIPPSIQ